MLKVYFNMFEMKKATMLWLFAPLSGLFSNISREEIEAYERLNKLVNKYII